MLYINARDINLNGSKETKILDASSFDNCLISFF